MIALELWMLRQFCNKHNIDVQEIDNTLTYAEAKQHLQALTGDPPTSDVWESQLEQYQKEHILSSYVAATFAKETVSSDVGKPYYPRFSLRRWIQKHSPSFSGGVKHCLL